MEYWQSWTICNLRDNYVIVWYDHCFINKVFEELEIVYPSVFFYIDGIVQDCNIYIADALEILQPYPTAIDIVYGYCQIWQKVSHINHWTGLRDQTWKCYEDIYTLSPVSI